MANKDYYEGTPERIVIVNGPTFGQGIKYIVFGAMLGAGAAYYVVGGIRRKSIAGRARDKATDKARDAANRAGRKASETASHVIEEVEDRVEAAGDSVEERLHSLADRVRDLSEKAKNTVEAANIIVKPAMERAVAEGKRAAAATQAKLKHDVDEAGDRPAIYQQDEDLPSQHEDKFVE